MSFICLNFGIWRNIAIFATFDSSNSPLCWDPCLELICLNFGIWRNIATLDLSNSPLCWDPCLEFWDLAKYRQIRHFRHCLHFWTYLDKRAETRSSFRRCSLFLNMSFISFFAVYFTAILVRSILCTTRLCPFTDLSFTPDNRFMSPWVDTTVVCINIHWTRIAVTDRRRKTK